VPGRNDPRDREAGREVADRRVEQEVDGVAVEDPHLLDVRDADPPRRLGVPEDPLEGELDGLGVEGLAVGEGDPLPQLEPPVLGRDRGPRFGRPGLRLPGVDGDERVVHEAEQVVVQQRGRVLRIEVPEHHARGDRDLLPGGGLLLGLGGRAEGVPGDGAMPEGLQQDGADQGEQRDEEPP
jgi:hypothetical protein